MSNAHKQTNHTRNRSFARAALAIAALSLIAFANSRHVQAQPQSQRSLLSRLAQTTGTDPASVTFKTGREYLDDQQWSKAQEKLSEYVKTYPSDKNVDQGLYWLAYSQLKLEQYNDCTKTLTQLFARYPRSAWTREGRTLYVQVPGNTSPPPGGDDDTEDFKVAVLYALFQADVNRGIAAATDFLKPGSTASVRLKGAALGLLARNGGKQVTPIILGVATNEPDLQLRTKAISALGSSQDDSVIGPLRDFALNSKENDIVEAALYAIGQHSSPQAIVVLGEIAMSTRPNNVRRLAISSIAQRSGDPAVDQLLKIYEAEQNVEIRRTVISGLANRKSPRAGEKLLDIARNSDNVELRKSAINGMARRSGSLGEPVIDKLLALYDTEKNEDVKDQIIGSLAHSNDKRVIQKLIDIAKNPQVPIERRKRAIGWLSRSKDPEVLRFLEDLLK